MVTHPCIKNDIYSHCHHLGWLISLWYLSLTSFMSRSRCSRGASLKQRCSLGSPFSWCSRQMQVVLRSSSKMSSARRRTQPSVLGSGAMERQQSLSYSTFRARAHCLLPTSFSAITVRDSRRRLRRTLAKMQLSSISTNCESRTSGRAMISSLRGRRASLLLRQFYETRRQRSSLMRLLKSAHCFVASSSNLSSSYSTLSPSIYTSSLFLAFTSCAISIILMTVMARFSSEGSRRSTSPLSSVTSSITHCISWAQLYRLVSCSLMQASFPARSTPSHFSVTLATSGSSATFVQAVLIITRPLGAYSIGRPPPLLPSTPFISSVMITISSVIQFPPFAVDLGASLLRTGTLRGGGSGGL